MYNFYIFKYQLKYVYKKSHLNWGKWVVYEESFTLMNSSVHTDPGNSY